MMGMKITVKNVKSEMDKLTKAFQKYEELNIEKKTNELLQELKSVTPVDTGHARDSWSVQSLNQKRAVIINSAGYIEILNAGSSKQAPAYFIERTALKYGNPVGTIVQVINRP